LDSIEGHVPERVAWSKHNLLRQLFSPNAPPIV
jgi:hypothetical protein